MHKEHNSKYSREVILSSEEQWKVDSTHFLYGVGDERQHVVGRRKEKKKDPKLVI